MSTSRSMFIGASLVAALAVTLPASSALAHGGKGGDFGASLEFSDLDLDGDGNLTKEELQNLGKARFARLDTDGDGQLSPAELQAAAAERQNARIQRMIERLDTDKNGMLSEAEMKEVRGKGGKRWGHGKRSEERREARMDRMFDRVDANEDGVISREEFDAAKAHMMKRRGGRED